METIVGILVGTAIGSSLGMLTALIGHEIGRFLQKRRWERLTKENK